MEVTVFKVIVYGETPKDEPVTKRFSSLEKALEFAAKFLNDGVIPVLLTNESFLLEE